jgi:hypothetical protein
VTLPVKMPPKQDEVGLFLLSKQDKSITFLEQALGSVVTKGLREVGETRLKYPNLSIKETSLKLFAIFLKAENPANTEYMKKKYMQKMQDFLEICTICEELSDLADEKGKSILPSRSLVKGRELPLDLNLNYRKVTDPIFDIFREKAGEGPLASVQRKLLQRTGPQIRRMPRPNRERHARWLLELYEVSRLSSVSAEAKMTLRICFSENKERTEEQRVAPKPSVWWTLQQTTSFKESW